MGLSIPTKSAHLSVVGLCEKDQLKETMRAIKLMKTHDVYLKTLTILPFLRVARIIEENQESNLRANVLIHNLYRLDDKVDVELVEYDSKGELKGRWIKGFFDAQHEELFPDEPLDVEGLL